MSTSLNDFVQRQMRKSKRVVPARAQAALALLEKLRSNPSLELQDHLASRGSSGLESHETFGKRAHERFGIEAINKNHGRRSSSLQDWGQELLDILRDGGFVAASQTQREQMIELAQTALATLLRQILDEEPLEVRVRGRTAAWAFSEILRQADEKGKAGDVAQYLVGAKLMLRLNIELPVLAANKGDRRARGDQNARLGDFEIEDAVIEVAIGLPDEKHLAQIVDALEASHVEVLLLTRDDRVRTWKDELKDFEGVDQRRVAVASVESFLGQNISEMSGFSDKEKLQQIHRLIELYNSRWIEQLRMPGIRIVVR